MTLSQFFLYVGTGILLAISYLFLLWKTVLFLPKAKHRGLFLLGSAIARIAFFLLAALYVSQKSAVIFLLITACFMLTRLTTLKFVKLETKDEYKFG